MSLKSIELIEWEVLGLRKKAFPLLSVATGHARDCGYAVVNSSKSEVNLGRDQIRTCNVVYIEQEGDQKRKAVIIPMRIDGRISHYLVSSYQEVKESERE